MNRQNQQTKRNFYEVLGVKQDAGQDEIKSTYRKLAHSKHPDRNKTNPNAAKEFAEISEAYHTLSDPQKRQQYDMMERDGGFEGGGFSGFEEFSFGGFDFQGGDIFEELFRGSGGRRSRQATSRIEGANIQKKVKLTLEEAYTGKEVEIDIERDELCETCRGSGVKDGPKHKCTRCKGTGYISVNMIIAVMKQTCPECDGSKYSSKSVCTNCDGNRLKKVRKKLRVPIVCGVEDGQSIRVAGAGSCGIDAPNGDLIVAVEVMPHPIFRRDRVDLYKTQYVRLVDMVLGGSTDVSSISDETFSVQIAPGSEVNSRIRIPNRGMRHTNSSSRGSLYIDLVPYIPNPAEMDREVLAAWEIIKKHEASKDPEIKKKINQGT